MSKIPIYCPLCCDQPFDSQQELFFHLRGIRNHLFCPICSEKFASLEYLVNHLSRKCYGPVSEPEAKRKCLLNNTQVTESFTTDSPVPPAVPPDKHGPVEKPGNYANATSPAPLPVVPPEIRNRLPKSVSVSVGPLENKSLQRHNTSAAKPVSALLEKGKIVEKTSESFISKSLSSLLTRVSLNPNVEINLATSKDVRSTPEKPLLPVCSINESSVKIVLNDVLRPSQSKNAEKPGPASSKGMNTTGKTSPYFKKPKGSSVEETKVNLNVALRNEIPHSNSNTENCKSTEDNSNDQVNSTSQDKEIKRGRGRPKKYNDNELIQIPSVNGDIVRERGRPKKYNNNELIQIPSLNGDIDEEKSSAEKPAKESASTFTKSGSDSIEEMSKVTSSKQTKRDFEYSGEVSNVTSTSQSKTDCDSSGEVSKVSSSRQNKTDSDSTEEVSNSSSVRTRRRKSISYCNLAKTDSDNDNSDHYEENGGNDSDEDYDPGEDCHTEEDCHPEEEPKKRVRFRDHKSNGSDGDRRPQDQLKKKVKFKDHKSENPVTSNENCQPEEEQKKTVKTKDQKSIHSSEESQRDERKKRIKNKVQNNIDNSLNKKKNDSSKEQVDKSEEKSSTESDKSVANEESKTEEEEEYTCSACNVRFTSIYEHIKQYHNGEEVVVEVPEEEIKEDLKAYQEGSECKISIGENESNKTSAIENEQSIPISEKKKQDETLSSSKVDTKSEKLKEEKPVLMGFKLENESSVIYTRTFKKVKQSDNQWVHSVSNKKMYYQFMTNARKLKLLIDEVQNNESIHAELKMPLRSLFENPKINVVEITFQPNTPYFTYKKVDFKDPMPMYVMSRQAAENPDLLGGIASYILARGSDDNTPFVSEYSKVIAVMKVILASDEQLTIENVVFNDKPVCADMVPVLEDVTEPDIPLLEGAKMLKWRCNKCLATTWKFPLTKDMHGCNACPICHKNFVSSISLKKHLVLHKRDGTKYCHDCKMVFVSKITLNSHLEVHKTHSLCQQCRLYVPQDNMVEHDELHDKQPSKQFPCSVCKKVFGNGSELKTHEAKMCSRLVSKFNCSLCDKKFFTQTALSYHSTAHNKASIRYPCSTCRKTFLQEKERFHRKAGKRKPSSYIQKLWHERIHSKDRPYLCKSCPKRFRSLAYQKAHDELVHLRSKSTRDIPVYMCQVCDKVFRKESQLINHMDQHKK